MEHSSVSPGSVLLEFPDVDFGAAREGLPFVSALQNRDDLSSAVLVRQRDGEFRKETKAFVRELYVGQRVVAVRVETGGQDKELGAEPFRCRGEQLLAD
jgi:hypothetical protein